ncbi:MAG: LPS export ABC transporter periplasmic protein LptC [Armatimonadetes bacterium]|nr:LPS export ABC transporter periplasmic protein LptC [Armatimonadota bacterium]
MRRSLYLGLVIAAAVLLVSIVAFKRYLPYANINFNLRQPPPVVLAMEDAYLVGLGHNGKLWSTKARSVEIAQNRSTTILTGIHDGKIFDKDKIALRVKAGHAVYDTYSRNLDLSEGILVEGTDRQRITGAGASWNSATSTLRSIGRVSFETASSKVTTDRLLMDLNKKELEMWDIHMSFNLNELANGAATNAR